MFILSKVQRTKTRNRSKDLLSQAVVVRYLHGALNI